MEKRESFIFYASWYDAAKLLEPVAREQFLSAVIEMGISGEAQEVKDPNARACLSLVAPQIRANLQKYMNGKRGGAPKGNQNASRDVDLFNQETTEKQPNDNQETTEKQPNDNQETTEKQPNDNQETTEAQPNVNVNENDNVNDNVVVEERWSKNKARPKDVEEVDAYMREYAQAKGYQLTFTAEHWFSYHEANGWKSGRNAMKDWKATIRTWFLREQEKQKTNGSNQRNTQPGIRAAQASNAAAYNIINRLAAEEESGNA